MCAVHRQIFRNHKFLYVDYSCILQEGLIFVIGRRLGKNIYSETAVKVANYNGKLDRLMQELRDLALFDVPYDLQQIHGVLSLDLLVHAGRVGLVKGKKCLDGTRTQVLNEIVDWIDSTDVTAPRIFWLHGQAGKGKSAIAHSIALYAQNLGMLGSCFCFTRVRQHEGLHTRLFPTIARDLADRDLRLRVLLAKVITNNHSLTDTKDVAEQWERFIVEPLSRLEGSLTGNVVVVIDALDESGAEATRSSILEAFAGNDRNLPGNLRILLTSRPVVDISDALGAARHIHVRSLDDTDAGHDILLYVSDRLRHLGDTFSDEDLRELAARSGGVFEWARLACDFVSHRLRVIAKKRFEEIVSLSRGDGMSLLDEAYIIFLKELVQGHPDLLVVFHSVMRQILWLKTPLSTSALDFMRQRFPGKHSHYSVRDILNMMASLLSGTNETSTPIRPLHASFYDFLLDERRSGEFFIEQRDVHRDLAVASLSVMRSCLCFNICGLETSYLLNTEIADLGKKVDENIPPYLLYSCRFWATHLQDGGFDGGLAELVGQFITGEQVLFWLEVLGVSGLIGEAYWALILAENWFQVNVLLCAEYQHTNDNLTGTNGV